MIADVPQAIEAVRKLYLDRQMAKMLGANGRSFAQQHSVGIQAHRWHRFFPDLLVSVDRGYGLTTALNCTELL